MNNRLMQPPVEKPAAPAPTSEPTAAVGAVKKGERKTYAIRGYLEYEALIPVGPGKVRVHFDGGSLTGYGSTPATFSTSDPVLQTIIEKSELWKSGKITRR